MRIFRIIISITLVLILLLQMVSMAVAHGSATLIAEPNQAAAGEDITITGSDMEDGENFTITLEGLFETFQLGHVEAADEGFSMAVTIPGGALPGLYSLVATFAEGETVLTEFVVLEAGSAAVDEHAEGESETLVTAEKVDLDLNRSSLEMGLAVGVILTAGIGGLWLVKRE